MSQTEEVDRLKAEVEKLKQIREKRRRKYIDPVAEIQKRVEQMRTADDLQQVLHLVAEEEKAGRIDRNTSRAVDKAAKLMLRNAKLQLKGIRLASQQPFQGRP